MHKIEIEAGTPADLAFLTLHSWVEAYHEPAEIVFNGISIIVNPGIRLDQIKAAYWAEYRKRIRAEVTCIEALVLEEKAKELRKAAIAAIAKEVIIK